MVIPGLRTCPPPDGPLFEAISARLDEGLRIVREQRQFAEFPAPALAFFNRRTAAGLALYDPWVIALNRALFEAHPEENLDETVLHELAHLVIAYGRRRRIIKGRPTAHGDAWQRVMRHWFQIEPRRTHDQDIAHLDIRRQRRWHYRCGCKAWQITTVRHNRIQKESLEYRCERCGGPLTFASPPQPP